MKAYQYLIIWNPTEQQEEDGQKSKIVSEIRTILARDERSATLIAARDIPKEYLEQIDQIEVALRPF